MTRFVILGLLVMVPASIPSPTAQAQLLVDDTNAETVPGFNAVPPGQQLAHNGWMVSGWNSQALC